MAITETLAFSSVNAIKADFNDLYNSKDPRRYFEVLGALDYVIPEIGGAALLQIAERLIREKGRPITILDIGCSYGILAAVMRFGLSVDQLQDRYAAPSIQALDSATLASRDTQYFASWAPRDDIKFIGLDCSAAAIGYARRVGLLADGIAADLENNPISEHERSLISEVDLIVSTGAVGYISEKTFAKLMQSFAPGRVPWVASFVLRMFGYEKIIETLGANGLVTEKLEDTTFVQRRFQDGVEAAETLRLLKERNVDPAGKEAEGLYHAELFLSRPSADIKRANLTEIVSTANGPSTVAAPRYNQ